jgi:4-amino-4-deoxy-L-arabinose transferase-like glycosyltransferase
MTFRPWHGLLLIMLLKLAVGLLLISQRPLWQYHEADFIRVARIINEAGRLPIASDYPNDDMETRQANQPPLYYFMMLPFVAALDDDQAVPPPIHPLNVCEGYNGSLIVNVTNPTYNFPPQGIIAAAYGLRLLSLALALVAVIGTYLAGRTLFPQHPLIAWGGAALIAFEPTLMLLASEINNDNLILALAALHLWCCARLLRRQGNMALNNASLLLLALLAILSKLTGWLLLGITLLLLALLMGRQLRQRVSARQIRLTLLGVGLFSAAVLAFMLFNLQQFGSVLGRYQNLEGRITGVIAQINWSIAPEMSLAVIQDTVNDYAAPLQLWNPRAAVWAAYRHVLLLAGLVLLASAVSLIRRRRWDELAAYALFALFTVLTVGLVLFRALLNNGNAPFVNTMTLINPVRYYATALPGLALAVSAAFVLLIPSSAMQRPIRWLRRLFALGSPSLAGLWLVVTTGSLFYPLEVSRMLAASILSPEAFAGLTDVTRIESDQPTDLPQVLGFSAEARPDAGLIDLTLYLTSPQALTENYMVEVDLLNGASQSCRFMPARGVYPTTRWQPNQVIVTQVEIPNCAVTSSAEHNLQLRWLQSPATRDIPPIVVSDALTLSTISGALGTAAQCIPNLGVIGEGLQIWKVNSPLTAQAGSVFTPSVNWLARTIIPEAGMRIFWLRQINGDLAYTCGSDPRQGTYPFARWVTGEMVYFDECPMALPDDTPPGVYQLSVSVLEGGDRPLPAVDAAGQPIPSGEVPLAQITILPPE